jgi:hypothetical protein
LCLSGNGEEGAVEELPDDAQVGAHFRQVAGAGWGCFMAAILRGDLSTRRPREMGPMRYTALRR